MATITGKPVMSMTAAVPDPVETPKTLTFTRKGYGRLMRNGSQLSQHIVAEEAYERAAREGRGTYRWVPAQIEIQVP